MLKNLTFPPPKIGDFWMDHLISQLVEQTNNKVVPVPVPKDKDESKSGKKQTRTLEKFNTITYELVNVPGDGNCGYHSFFESHEFKQIQNDKKQKNCRYM